MESLNAVALVLHVFNLGAFGWGMARFFQKVSGHQRRTAVVASLAVAFAIWHVRAAWVATPLACSSGLAVALDVAALALFLAAVRACRRNRPTAIFEADEPRWMMTEGPYRWVRHPFYLSYILFWTAGALASRSPIDAFAAVVMSCVYVTAALEEEAKFRCSPLAKEYAGYRRSTGFLLPWRRRPWR